MQQNFFQFKKKITMKNIPFLYSMIKKKYHAHAQRSSYVWLPPKNLGQDELKNCFIFPIQFSVAAQKFFWG